MEGSELRSQIKKPMKDGLTVQVGQTEYLEKQWGAKPETLHWHYLSLNSHVFTEETPEKSRFARAIEYWKKLPVRVTRLVGLIVRKHISL